jgi:hypothetical protein
MAIKAKNAAVVLVRSKKTIALPPATLGFCSLVTPDTYDPDKPAFKANFHYGDKAWPLLVDTVQKHCMDANLAKLQKEAAFDLKDPCDVAEWVGDKKKTPKEGAKLDVPHLVVMTKADYKDRDGNVVRREITCWDRHNNLLDLKSLRLGFGSIVEPIVHANLFASKAMKSTPTPSLQLVGLRILKLVQFGGQSAPAETDEDAIREALGDDFAMDEDLSAYSKAKAPAAPPAGGGDVEDMF